MEVSKNYGHQHPLVLLNEEQLITHQSGVIADCSRCGEKVSAPCFRCAEDCGFYLHKVCADAPLELNHPFHRNHPLLLMQKAPYRWICDFCDGMGEKFVYHCSCGLDLHIKCALFTFNIAQNNLKALEHVALEDPLISTKIDVRKCFGCWEPLANDAYFSPHCEFNLHKKRAKLPFKLNHMCHRKHPLLLQFNSDRLSCKICQETRRRGFVYGCSPCKFAIHIQCVSPKPIIEDKSHPRPFSSFLRQAPFICDACSTEGIHVAYTCGTCSVIVHKECISLPRIIKSRFHDHRVFHTYSLHKEGLGSLNCLICHDEVNTDYGSYYCTDCDIIFHVKCATKDSDWYYVVPPENEDEKPLDVNSITKVLERNVAGEATLIEHFKHNHYLTLRYNNREYGDKCVMGVCYRSQIHSMIALSVSSFFIEVVPNYQNEEYLVSSLPISRLVLTSDDIFECELCDWVSNGFAYKCNECGRRLCLRCASLKPGSLTCPGHQHPLLLYIEGQGSVMLVVSMVRSIGVKIASILSMLSVFDCQRE
ncbi:uncharacterized protein LOC120128220 [Hibiscus syriacus]|uniref:uncharacterized protein LOC120128220 n=1 Tax=Hibiscus syriacus TaxID=106335 RepID=UPI0019225C9F|nr:uncharacterized protein LOC120128220 [Hibiscus syriacus]